ncbi:Uncharacterized protein APZ42_028850 [Daphnia magna]|uniref:Uncharacterized protein n=1 Tax=Daphnia magna TaxID=35525 RepID=A0A164Q4N0_9CRUS|nr:Uncharacterized protein APZ42_028850 [Daphnia magna]
MFFCSSLHLFLFLFTSKNIGRGRILSMGRNEAFHST